ncbi:hypothetical protein [Halocella sp. SP3-1]|nr:hypothetical protein [Halocella sp. SP3-1]
MSKLLSIYPLTAPAVIPCTTCLGEIRYTIITGIETTTRAAIN